MARTATATPSKTDFVKEFLNVHPQGNAKDVNEAWTAAGMNGTISHTVVSEVRKELGLIGSQQAKIGKPSKKAAVKVTKPAKKKVISKITKPATTSPSKTSFVEKFLNAHPQGNIRAVNEAWSEAGFDGTIGSTLINKMRARMGLTGNLRANTKTAAKKKPAPRKPKTEVATPGKTSFLKEYLHDNPKGNVAAVNAAWQAQGFAGTISPALVNKTRAELGLTGNLRGKTKKTKTAAKAKLPYTGKKRGRKPKETTAAVNGQPRGRKSGRTLALTDLESDIDRLLFKAMAIGNLTEVEDSLRRVRRLLYGALTQG